MHRRVACAEVVFGLALKSLAAGALCLAQDTPSTGATRFIVDGNRIYAELGFVRPDGSIHRALAFVDMGSPTMTLRESLFKELQLDRGQPLSFKLGELSIQVPRANVISEPREPSAIGSELKVEAMLSAGILQQFVLVIDYATRTLALSRPGPVKALGVPVPFHINRRTGLVAVDVVIDGHPYRITIDNGSAFTWFRQRTAAQWLVSHPEWERGVGAVGPSNMMMSGDGTETSGILLRIPTIFVGSLVVHDVGGLAAGRGRTFPGDLDLFDWYSQKNATPVIGWIGGNVLKQFRLTIDYPHQMMYWLRQNDPDAHELDQVGLTLRSEHGEYVVAAVVMKNGTPTVEGVLPGDKLVRVGELDVGRATWGAIYDAMHGQPGESRQLIVERNGLRFTVAAKVTAF